MQNFLVSDWLVKYDCVDQHYVIFVYIFDWRITPEADTNRSGHIISFASTWLHYNNIYCFTLFRHDRCLSVINNGYQNVSFRNIELLFFA